MGMDLIFAVRGLLSFVAFTEFTSTIRCFWPLGDDSYIQEQLFSGIKLASEAERTLSHTYGLFSGLVGLVIIHTAIFAHYRPLITLALSAELLKISFLVLEILVFGSIKAGQHLVFPVVTGVVTIISCIGLLFLTSDGTLDDHENLDLVKRARKLRKNR